MALISSTTIITSLSLFHLALAFFFLTNPRVIADQALVFILGEAMGVPSSRAFDAPSAPLALLSLVLTILSLSDLTSLSLPLHAQHLHWSSQSPLRFLITFSLSMYTFLFGPNSPMFNKNPRGRLAHPASNKLNAAGYAASSWGMDGLKNRVTFTFLFLEAMAWFWVFTTLREERASLVRTKAREQ